MEFRCLNKPYFSPSQHQMASKLYNLNTLSLFCPIQVNKLKDNVNGVLSSVTPVLLDRFLENVYAITK